MCSRGPAGRPWGSPLLGLLNTAVTGGLTCHISCLNPGLTICDSVGEGTVYRWGETPQTSPCLPPVTPATLVLKGGFLKEVSKGQKSRVTRLAGKPTRFREIAFALVCQERTGPVLRPVTAVCLRGAWAVLPAAPGPRPEPKPTFWCAGHHSYGQSPSGPCPSSATGAAPWGCDHEVPGHPALEWGPRPWRSALRYLGPDTSPLPLGLCLVDEVQWDKWVHGPPAQRLPGGPGAGAKSQGGPGAPVRVCTCNKSTRWQVKRETTGKAFFLFSYFLNKGPCVFTWHWGLQIIQLAKLSDLGSTLDVEKTHLCEGHGHWVQKTPCCRPACWKRRPQSGEEPSQGHQGKGETKFPRNQISLARFMNLSIQNFILFLILTPSPSRLRRIREKWGLKQSRTLQGLPKHKNTSVSHVSCLQKKAVIPKVFPEFQIADSSSY